MRIAVRQTAATAVLALGALMWSSATARAAGVLDAVPQDAFVVVKVSNLGQTSQKISRWAQALGLAQMVPQFADPLGAMEKEMKITQGLDRSGEMAFVFLDPKVYGKGDDAMVVLAPTRDFNAFAGNYKASGLKPVAGAAGVSSFQMPDGNGKDVFIADWGGYAAMSPSQKALAKKPAAGGFKLSKLAAQEGKQQDILMFVNINAVRSEAVKWLEELRGQMTKELDKAGQAPPPGAAARPAGPEAEMVRKFGPVIKAMFNQYINGAKAFMNDADGAFIGLSLGEAGLNATFAADFKPGSYIGDLAAKTKNSNQDLMAGLPARKYFAFGGMTVTKETLQKLVNDIADPIARELAAVGPEGKTFADAIESTKGSAGAIESFAFGYTVPTGALGADSIVQAVTVMKGDARTIGAAQGKMLSAVGKLLGDLPAAGGGKDAKMSFEQQPGGKTVGGVKLDTYKFNIAMDENNPQAAQVQQMMAFVYGPGGMGGAYGAVDPKTFVVVQGGTDQLLADAIASAKAGADPLSKLAPVVEVNKALPTDRFLVEYVDLAQIVTSAVKYAQGFGLPVKMALPPALPPIGMSASTSGPAVRLDVHVPTSLVQSLIAAGMQTYMQMQGGGAGQPDGL
jgi:hypothetical protein